VQRPSAQSTNLLPLFFAASYMQQEPTENSESRRHTTALEVPSHSAHDGSLHHEADHLQRVRSAASGSSRSASPRSTRLDPLDAVDANQLDERLRGLSLRDGSGSRHRPTAAGQRILDYENALTPPTPRQAMGFKVIKRSDSFNGVKLTDFPNGQFLRAASSPVVKRILTS